MYTDGVTECISPSGGMMEMDGFLKMVHRFKNKPPKEMVGALLAQLREFMGSGEQHDDITLTVLRKL